MSVDEYFDLHNWRNAVASPQGPVNDTTRLVLLALSLHMNPQGVAWPSQETLVERTALSRRTVQTALRRAERDGWIVRSLQDQPGQRWRLTRYRAVFPGYVDPPAKPWDREPWRHSEDEAGATTAPRSSSGEQEAGAAIAPPSTPPAAAEPRRWRNNCTEVAQPLLEGGANDDQKVAQPLRTNYPENYPENCPREGALTRTGDERASDDTHRVLNIEAWREWLAYRSDRRLPMLLPPSSTKLAEWLAALPEAEQSAIVHQAIRNGWKSLYPLKAAGNGQAGGSRYDRLSREFEARAASVLAIESAEESALRRLRYP